MINHIHVSIQLPKVYPITDTTISGLSHSEQVKRLIAGGAALIQLRDKQASSRAFYSDAQAAIQIARAAGVKLIINDRVDIALALRADGVHLGQSDMPVEAARRILGEQAVIGFSTHNLEQIRRALSLPISYLAFGPIFPTASKLNPDPVAGLNQLKRVREMSLPTPVVAIGGINISNALDVLNAGASSVAVISAVLANPSRIAANLQQIMTSTE